MMALKKDDIPLIREPVDWLRIIQALTVAICTVITTWGAIAASRAATAGKVAADEAVQTRIVAASEVASVKETVQQIQVQTDGTLTAAKLSVALSAEALANATKKPDHLKTAEEARAAYEAQLENQKKADNRK